MMSFKDLRGYIAQLETMGEIKKIFMEVDWNLELGAIIRRSLDLKAPAPLFQKIKDYPPGYRVLGAPVAPSNQPNRYFTRLATALRMPPEYNAIDIIETYIANKKKARIKPIQVTAAPCKEHIFVGDKVDLYQLPAPIIHSGDGGRYLCTWSAVITRDPDTGWTNWGNYRMMIHDQNTLGGVVSPHQHIGMHFQKYEALNQPMEFAVALGTDPLIAIISGSITAPAGVDEGDLVGTFMGEPVQLIRCETVDLEVPSGAEIILEGEVIPGERKEEGPFGEYSGYQTSSAPQPIFKVKAITHRTDPILPVVCAGVPVEDHVCVALSLAADILDVLREHQLPVTFAYIPPFSSLHRLLVSVKESRVGLAQQIAEVAWSTQLGRALCQIIVVNDDIDIIDPGQTEWAMATRLHPERGIIKYRDKIFLPYWAFLRPEERINRQGYSVVFDCTWPPAWEKEAPCRKASLDSLWPKDIQDRVLKNWQKYGYETI
jgi:4-hydroxy-3-polyprenylbenzoate decarboxylase